MGRQKQNFGPTVDNGVVLRTSVSALTTFDPASYGGCPRRWWFTRVAGVKEEETVAQGMGTEIHAQLEHYLENGEDVLGPVARAGKYLLPAPGKDLVREAAFGDLGTAIALRRAGAAAVEIERAAGLVAGGIPLDGYIDLRHGRGEYVVGSGLAIVQKEKPEHGRVIEVIDHKTSSSIEKFSKSPTEMASSIQMVGYANYVLNTIPDVDHVRVSHIYYQTRGPKEAKKVTALLSASVARAAWEPVHQIAKYMEEVARAPRVEDVEPNKASCTAYRGCPHVSRCPITRTLSTGGNKMSLFNTIKPVASNGTISSLLNVPLSPAPEAVAAPSTGSLFGSLLKNKTSLPDTARQVAIDAEKERLAVEDIAPALLEAAQKDIASGDLKPDGSGQVYSRSGAGQGYILRQPTMAEKLALSQATIVPSDAPKSTGITSAAPLSQQKIDEITDPEIRQRAEAHAQAHAQAQAEAPAADKKGGRCPVGGSRLALTDAEKVKRIKKCPGCGKEWKTLKDEWFTEDCSAIIAPNHNLPKEEPRQAPVQVVVQQQAPVQAVVQQQASVQQQAPVQQASTQQKAVGITLYIDALVERGPQAVSLDNWYQEIVSTLEKNYDLQDIRLAPPDNALGYGKWRAAIALMVKEHPPEPGVYYINNIGTNEFAAAAAETLAPLCSIVVRGRR